MVFVASDQVAILPKLLAKVSELIWQKTCPGAYYCTQYHSCIFPGAFKSLPKIPTIQGRPIKESKKAHWKEDLRGKNDARLENKTASHP